MNMLSNPFFLLKRTTWRITLYSINAIICFSLSETLFQVPPPSAIYSMVIEARSFLSVTQVLTWGSFAFQWETEKVCLSRSNQNSTGPYSQETVPIIALSIGFPDPPPPVEVGVPCCQALPPAPVQLTEREDLPVEEKAPNFMVGIA